MKELKFKLVASEEEMQGALAVRKQVFIEEQNIPPEIELDEDDSRALHMVVRDGEKSIGTARVLFPAPGQAKIERMAVLKPLRRRGIGRQIISFLSQVLDEKQIEQAILHAQYPAVPFYKSCGFEETGTPFYEAGIKHIKMQRRIS